MTNWENEFLLSLPPMHSRIFHSLFTHLFISLFLDLSLYRVSQKSKTLRISPVWLFVEFEIASWYYILKRPPLVMSVIFQGRVRCGPFVFFKKIRTPISWCIFKKIGKLKALSKKKITYLAMYKLETTKLRRLFFGPLIIYYLIFTV